MKTTKRTVWFLIAAVLLTAALVYAQAGASTVVTLADITGDGAAHSVQSAASASARWVLFVCPSTNTGTVRIGDSAVSATQGVPVAAGGGFMLPPIPAAVGMRLADQYYKLNTVYYLVASGDKVSVVWGK